MKRKIPRDYATERQLLLIELYFVRKTSPARRVVKHIQMQMRKLRNAHRMGLL